MSSFKVAMITSDNHPIPDWVAEKFSSAGIEYLYHECYTREELEKFAGDADVLMVMSSRSDLVVEENRDIFKKVGAVIKCGSGTDSLQWWVRRPNLTDSCTMASGITLQVSRLDH